MTRPLTRPDGTEWEPTPEASEKLRAAMFGTVRLTVMARLAQVRRHGKGGGL